MVAKTMEWIVDFLTQPLLSFEKRMWVYAALYLLAILLPLLLIVREKCRRRFK